MTLRATVYMIISRGQDMIQIVGVQNPKVRTTYRI